MSVIERDHVPDFIVRAGIRSLLATRLRIGREVISLIGYILLSTRRWYDYIAQTASPLCRGPWGSSSSARRRLWRSSGACPWRSTQASKSAFIPCHIARVVEDEGPTGRLSLLAADANTQHYEVPTPYFLLCLGEHLKYSSFLYDR